MTALFQSAVMLFVLSEAAAAADPFQPGVAGGVLRVAQKAEPKTLNPLVALDAPSREAIRLMHGDLITINRLTLKTEPGLAQSWTVSKDGKQFELQLRKGLKFSDGHPFDADDVVFTFQVYTDPEIASPQRDLLTIGSQPLKVVKVGAHTVRVSLAEPYAAAERLFDGIAMLPRHLLEKEYRAGRLGKVWGLSTPAEQMAGLGPFRLREYRPGEWLRLDRNPHYWKTDEKGQRLPYLSEVLMRFTGSEENQVLRFLAGEVDVLGRLTARSFATLSEARQAGEGNLADAGSSLEYNFVFLNLNPSVPAGVGSKQEWFQDKRFRKSLSLAADRDSIIRLVYGGRATPLWSHVPPGNRLWVAPDVAKPSRSIAVAKGLLKEAGFRWNASGRLVDPKGKPVQFSILVSASSPDRREMAAILAADWNELGMDVNVAALEFRSVLDRVLRTKDYEACLLGLGGGDADPNPEMNVWLSSGSMHLWSPQQKSPVTEWEARLDNLMRQQMVTLDPEARRKLFHQVQRIVAEELPIISLASPHILTAASRKIGNFRPAIVDSYALWNVERLFWTEPRR